MLSQKAILNNASKRSFWKYSRCGIAGFHFSYSVPKSIVDGLLFGSTEYIFTPENLKQMHIKGAKHLNVGEAGVPLLMAHVRAIGFDCP